MSMPKNVVPAYSNISHNSAMARLNDMLVCLIGALALPVLIVIGSLFGKKPEKFIVPQWDDRSTEANAKVEA